MFVSAKPEEVTTCETWKDGLKGNINCAYYHVLHAIMNTTDVYTDTTMYHQMIIREKVNSSGLNQAVMDVLLCRTLPLHFINLLRNSEFNHWLIRMTAVIGRTMIHDNSECMDG